MGYVVNLDTQRKNWNSSKTEEKAPSVGGGRNAVKLNVRMYIHRKRVFVAVVVSGDI